jgi:hypothetical protein
LYNLQWLAEMDASDDDEPEPSGGGGGGGNGINNSGGGGGGGGGGDSIFSTINREGIVEGVNVVVGGGGGGGHNRTVSRHRLNDIFPPGHLSRERDSRDGGSGGGGRAPPSQHLSRSLRIRDSSPRMAPVERFSDLSTLGSPTNASTTASSTTTAAAAAAAVAAVAAAAATAAAAAADGFGGGDNANNRRAVELIMDPLLQQTLSLVVISVRSATPCNVILCCTLT